MTFNSTGLGLALLALAASLAGLFGGASHNPQPRARQRLVWWNPALCLGYLRDEHLQLLTAVGKGAEFVALARGNAKQAKHLRDAFSTATEPCDTPRP